MRLFYSTTSPYARIARVALAEKGRHRHRPLPTRGTTSPTCSTPTERVPAALDSGLPLTENLLIVLWLGHA
jgi:glutathione S-transferase